MLFQKEVENFHITRTIAADRWNVLLDEDAKKFHQLQDNLYEGWKLSDMLGDLIAEGIDAALEVQEND